MDPFTAVGAAASILTILEATRAVFTQIIGITRTVYKYSEKSEKVIRQCTFDADTIHAIAETIKRKPHLFQDEAEWNSLEQVLYHLQSDLLKIKARIEPLRQDSIVRRLNFALREKTLSDLDHDVFNWSQRLYIRFSFLLLRLQTELYENGTAPSSLRRIPEILSQHLMRDIATKAQTNDSKMLRRDVKADKITLVGAPSMQMQASMEISAKLANVIIEFRPYPTSADTRMIAELEQRVSQLAAIFQHAKPSLMYTMSSHGYYNDQSNSRFGLIYKVHAGSADFTRLDTLIQGEQEPTCSLTERFEIARRVAIAVAFVHGVGWVHKAIQTRRVLLFFKRFGQS
ncbi:hypothetical protein GQ44DRAFT_714494 [Phaeosphaeriaceae sp. PMI808]|nr:hypothetical protein GQ44DRAFT_714494 [Phaeosphaeriaceae sp. PMI808]